MTFLQLPQEVLSNVVAFLEPVDILQFGLVCRDAHDFISPANQILWRSAFLHVFDDPEDAWRHYPASYHIPRQDWDWHAELERRFRALRALSRRFARDDESQYAEDHIEAILSILDTAKYGLTKFEVAQGKAGMVDDRSSLNIQLLQTMQQHSHGLERLLFETRRKDDVPDHELEHSPGRPMTRSRTVAARDATRPESASRLHALFGLTMKERIDSKLRGTARRKVYNWDFTSQDTDYGPFCLDGSGKVNWSLLEAAATAICRNFELCVDGRVAIPGGLAYAIPHRTLTDPTVPEDWARVTGVWLGTYAFLDYSDLFAFNAGTNMGLGVPPNLEDEPEACGDLMRMESKLDMSVKHDPRLKTNVPVSEDLPVLYFTGQSRGTGYQSHPITAVKGFAALVKGGREVRWKFVIAYNGVDQWQLEGVQPGGIRSGGVYGVWSQVNHEQAGPIGPFCYFPMELCKPTSIVLAT